MIFPPQILTLDVTIALRYYLRMLNMIKSFRCRDTQGVFERSKSKRFSNLTQLALRKLLLLEGSDKLEDLTVPPANRLEKLKGRRKGQYSIRINDQWRICFDWRNGDAYKVEIVDYH